MLQDYKLRLYREGRLPTGSINRILGTLRVMFRYAVRMRELPFDPMEPVKEFREIDRQRGILALAELAKLFGPDALALYWNREPRHYAINLLAASTGTRLGECQALRVKAIDSRGFIDVCQSWDDRYGMGQPKRGSRRFVAVPAKTAEAINALLALNRWGEPQPDDVVFWGQDRHTPSTKTAVLTQFKAALRRIGIPEEQRATRNLVFHSHRHGFETLIRGRVDAAQLRRVMGHKTIAVSDDYDHPQPEHLADVKAEQEKLFAQ
jgi:integrase